MAQYIKQAPLWGRIGTGFGQGLSEQLPKEMEHYQRKNELNRFAQNAGGMTPIQQVAGASSIYGATPQMIDSLTQVAKLDNRRNATANLAGQQGPAASANLEDVQRAKILDEASRGNAPMQNQNGAVNLRQAGEAIRQGPKPNQEQPQPRVGNVNENPFNPNSFAKQPWPTQQVAQRANEYGQMGFTPDESWTRAKEDEAKDLATSATLDEQQKQVAARQERAREEFDRQLEQKTQKKGENLFRDVPGPVKTKLERGMMRELRTSPNAVLESIADKWSDKGLEVAKASDEFYKDAATWGPEHWTRGDQMLGNLKQKAKIFRDAEASEEYYNMLRFGNAEGQETSQGKQGFGLSPQAAATIAFEPSEPVKGYISSFEPKNFKTNQYGRLPDYDKIQANAAKAAVEIGKKITTNDSILSIVRALQNKDPYFDTRSFIEQLREDQDDIGLNARQKREIGEDNSYFLPHWGDLKLFKNWGRRVGGKS